MPEVWAALPPDGHLGKVVAPAPRQVVTRAEAERECRRLAAEHPDRETHAWLAREGPGGNWSVAKLPLPPGVKLDPLKASVETKPRPPEPDDPRSAIARNVPPYG
jgi:hypothetical protein